MAKPSTRRPQPPKKEDRVITTVKIRADLHSRARHFALDHKKTWGDVLDAALESYLKDSS